MIYIVIKYHYIASNQEDVYTNVKAFSDSAKAFQFAFEENAKIAKELYKAETVKGKQTIKEYLVRYPKLFEALLAKYPNIHEDMPINTLYDILAELGDMVMFDRVFFAGFQRDYYSVEEIEHVQ